MDYGSQVFYLKVIKPRIYMKIEYIINAMILLLLSNYNFLLNSTTFIISSKHIVIVKFITKRDLVLQIILYKFLI